MPIEYVNLGQDPIAPTSGADWAAAPASTAFTANQLYLNGFSTMFPINLHGIAYEVGTVSNGNVLACVYNSSGILIAQSASTAQGTASTIQQLPLLQNIPVLGSYYLGLIGSSATGTAFMGLPFLLAGSVAAGAFAPPQSIVLPLVYGSVATPKIAVY